MKNVTVDNNYNDWLNVLTNIKQFVIKIKINFILHLNRNYNKPFFTKRRRHKRLEPMIPSLRQLLQFS